MRHRNKKAILNRPADQRKALIRNQITSLFLFGKVKTTDAKAVALASATEKLISKIKGKEDREAIRDLNKVIFTKDSSVKALQYAKTTKKISGFTRITKIGFRAGDSAKLVQVELIDNNE